MIRFIKQVRRTQAAPLYNIGAASRLSGLPAWTLRWIEKHGLVSPDRTSGNQRLFSTNDVDHLLEIRRLLTKKVNLAGIRIIIRLKKDLGEL